MIKTYSAFQGLSIYGRQIFQKYTLSLTIDSYIRFREKAYSASLCFPLNTYTPFLSLYIFLSKSHSTSILLHIKSTKRRTIMAEGSWNLSKSILSISPCCWNVGCNSNYGSQLTVSSPPVTYFLIL